MKKTISFLTVASVSLICGSYLFMDKNSEDRFQPLSYSSKQDVQNVNVDLNEQNPVFESVSTAGSPEQKTTSLLSEVKHYSNTFETTSDYEAASQFGALPAHLSDLRIIELPFNDQGQLIVDEKVKQLIEFFLMTKTSEGIDQAIERLYEYLDMTLPEPAKSQARTLAAQYLNYKEQLDTPQFSDATNLGDEASLAKIKEALDERKKLRRDILGEQHSDAIFGYEERYEDFSFARLQINANTNLSDEEKDRQIALAENSLPEDLAAKVRFKRESKSLERKIAVLKQSTGNEAEIFELRKQVYGEKAAQRLAYIEDNSYAWQQRVNEFYQQQAAIRNNETLTNEEKSQQIQRLKDQSFSYKEQVKLAVQMING